MNQAVQTTVNPQQEAINELRSVIVHQAAQLLQKDRDMLNVQGQNQQAMQANAELVGEVQRLRGVLEQKAAEEKARAEAAAQQTADVGSVGEQTVED